jgi:hypothetical protein
VHLAADRLIAIAALAATLVGGCGSVSNEPFSQQAYVWQRAWTPAVSEAVREVPPPISKWRVLVAEANATGGWRQFEPDISALESGHRSLVAVIRIDGQRHVTDAQRLAGDILARFGAFPRGIWAELEVDYDCPTNALAQYARLLTARRSRLPSGIGLSITALSLWPSSPDCRDHLRLTLSAGDSYRGTSRHF